MRSPIINIDNARNIVDAMKSTFDSHDFLTMFILSYTVEYLALLRRYHSVNSAHEQIGRYLINYSGELGIRKIGEIESENIFGNLNKCGLWEKRQH